MSGLLRRQSWKLVIAGVAAAVVVLGSGTLDGAATARGGAGQSVGDREAAVQPEAVSKRSAYFRIAVSPDCTLYAMVRGNELRFSATPEGLAAVPALTAQNVQAQNLERDGVWYRYTFPEATLTVPPDQLPAGFTELKVIIQHSAVRFRDKNRRQEEHTSVYAELGFCRDDEQGAEWSYWWHSYSETGARPLSAPTLTVPKPGKLDLKITTQQKEQRQIGIAVQAVASEAALADVRKGGVSVKAKLEVLDSDGKVVATETKTLGELGFT